MSMHPGSQRDPGKLWESVVVVLEDEKVVVILEEVRVAVVDALEEEELGFAVARIEEVLVMAAATKETRAKASPMHG